MTLAGVGTSLMDLWSNDGTLLSVIEDTAANLAAFIECCCPVTGCCPCPTPTSLTAVFTQISGPPCPALDGYEYVLTGNALEPGEECHQSWTGANEHVGDGDVEMNIICDPIGPEYVLNNLSSPGTTTYLHYPGDPSQSTGQLISVQCDPFRLVYRVEVLPSTFICLNETGIPQIFEIVVTETP